MVYTQFAHSVCTEETLQEALKLKAQAAFSRGEESRTTLHHDTQSDGAHDLVPPLGTYYKLLQCCPIVSHFEVSTLILLPLASELGVCGCLCVCVCTQFC